jgi:dipeptidyl-peptidase-4
MSSLSRRAAVMLAAVLLPSAAVAREARACTPDVESSTLPASSIEGIRGRLDEARARIGTQVARYHDPVGPRTWIDGSRLWYAEAARDGARRWWLCDAAGEPGAARLPLFDHAAVAALVRSADDRIPVRGASVVDGRVVLSIEGREQPVVCALGGAIIAESDPAARAALETSLRPGKRRSRGQGASVQLTFENRLGEAVEILWVDRAHVERSYGRIEAGASRRQQTFGGHAWYVRTASGRDLGHVVATDNDRLVVVGDAPPAEPEAVDTLDGQREVPGDGATDASASTRLPSDEMRYEVRAERGELMFVEAGGREFFRARGPSPEAGERDGFTGGHWVSPARDAVLAMRVVRADPRRVTIVEAAPRDQLQPKVRDFGYVKPGDPIDTAVPHLFRVERDASGALAAREIPLDRALYATPWSIDRVRFLPGGREVAFLYNQRGHQVVRLVAVDLATGAARAIAEESFPTFVDYTNKIWMHWLDGTGELLWMTERYGWNHIVLVDAATGLVKRKVTQGTCVVRRVEHVDARARTVDVAIMGRDPAQDPYHVHFARVSIDTGEVTMLTSGDGTCRVEFSPDRSALVSVRARADAPPVYELRRAADGAAVAELGRGDDAAMRAAGWIAPERFVAKGRDGVTDVWGLVHRPSGYDPTRKYPVIESIYAGPHGQHVPKWFELGGRSREYAELGAIVVQIDGMGTNWRSKAFHDVCWKNLKDAGFPDRIAWLRALATRDSAVDLSRVGIFGGSAGGQNAMRAVLDHADFYRVAVADCGCHDNRMDKIWWNEQWMGWPVDESYARNSNMEDAGKLGGRLLLVVGALDENVDPASTMQVAQRLIDAGKDFELLVIPDAGHGAAEGAYGNARRARFLLDALESGNGAKHVP